MSEIKLGGAKTRGSSRLSAMSPDELRRSISLARSSYKIERWWKYGQPRIDRIAATLNVPSIDDASKVITDLIGKHGTGYQINLDVFPYGIPKLDGVRVNVNIDQATH